MEVHCIYGFNYDSNIYIVLGKKPTIIDCGTGLFNDQVAKKIIEIIDPKKIEQIILTHEHYDHCGGVRKIHEMTDGNAKIFAYVDASEQIEKGDSHFAKMLGGVMPKIGVDIKLKENDVVKIGDEDFIVLHTPGHTPGSICLYDKKSKSLISGDTIFPFGSFGRYDFPEGNGTLLKESIVRLSKLDICNLYPGHESIVEGDANKHMSLTLKNSKYIV